MRERKRMEEKSTIIRVCENRGEVLNDRAIGGRDRGQHGCVLLEERGVQEEWHV